MESTLTTAQTATRLHVTAHTIAAWCRTGAIAAVKTGRRWAIRASTIARLICPTRDRLRAGEHQAPLTGRAARRAAARRLARATSREYRIPLIGHHQRARMAAANAGRILCRDYLFGLGLDVEFIEEYESAFGRATAKAFRANHHAEPDVGGLVVLHGRLWRTMRYVDMADLEAGAREHKKTAAELALAA
jgi:excisionase family DNA binding protein